MQLINNLNMNEKLLNFFFILLPISHLAGNLAINIIITFIIIFGLLVFDKNNITKNINNIFSYLIFFFFLLLAASTFVELKNSDGENNNAIKALLFFRYFILIVLLMKTNINLKLNLKYFLISCLACSLLLSLDVIYQAINGSDLFGYKSIGRYNAGFLGDELVAGGYIQRFLFLGIFAIPLINNKPNKFNFLFVLILSIGFTAIVLSGNRMPVLLFVPFVFMSVIFIKKLRKEFIAVFLISLIIYPSLIYFNSSLKRGHDSLINNIVVISKVFTLLERKYPELEKYKGTVFHHRYINDFSKKEKEKYENLRFGSGHRIAFLTAIDTYLDSPFIGSGIKGFRAKCKEKLHLPNRMCESHPHNYYLDILNSTGAIGLILLLIVLFFIYRRKHVINSNLSLDSYFFYNAVFINLAIEFFPIRSSGGFFSTTNASYIFFLLGLVLSFSFYYNSVLKKTD